MLLRTRWHVITNVPQSNYRWCCCCCRVANAECDSHPHADRTEPSQNRRRSTTILHTFALAATTDGQWWQKLSSLSHSRERPCLSRSNLALVIYVRHSLLPDSTLWTNPTTAGATPKHTWAGWLVSRSVVTFQHFYRFCCVYNRIMLLQPAAYMASLCRHCCVY